MWKWFEVIYTLLFFFLKKKTHLIFFHFDFSVINLHQTVFLVRTDLPLLYLGSFENSQSAQGPPGQRILLIGKVLKCEALALA